MQFYNTPNAAVRPEYQHVTYQNNMKFCDEFGKNVKKNFQFSWSFDIFNVQLESIIAHSFERK